MDLGTLQKLALLAAAAPLSFCLFQLNRVYALIDTAAAAKMPGVRKILTGKDLAADKIGGLICGWMIHSKDGSPMKAGAHPALAQGKVRYVGDHVAVVIADTYALARAAARAAKDFAASDALRDELARLGIEVADGATGTTWRVKL